MVKLKVHEADSSADILTEKQKNPAVHVSIDRLLWRVPYKLIHTADEHWAEVVQSGLASEHHRPQRGQTTASPDSWSGIRRPRYDQAQHRLPARVDHTRNGRWAGSGTRSGDIPVVVAIAAGPRPRFRQKARGELHGEASVHDLCAARQLLSRPEDVWRYGQQVNAGRGKRGLE